MKQLSHSITLSLEKPRGHIPLRSFPPSCHIRTRSLTQAARCWAFFDSVEQAAFRQRRAFIDEERASVPAPQPRSARADGHLPSPHGRFPAQTRLAGAATAAAPGGCCRPSPGGVHRAATSARGGHRGCSRATFAWGSVYAVGRGGRVRPRGLNCGSAGLPPAARFHSCFLLRRLPLSERVETGVRVGGRREARCQSAAALQRRRAREKEGTSFPGEALLALPLPAGLAAPPGGIRRAGIGLAPQSRPARGVGAASRPLSAPARPPPLPPLTGGGVRAAGGARACVRVSAGGRGGAAAGRGARRVGTASTAVAAEERVRCGALRG